MNMNIDEIIEELDKLAKKHEVCAGSPSLKPLAPTYLRTAKILRAAIALLKTHQDNQPNEPQGDGWIRVKDCDPADPAQLKSLCVKLRELARAERDGRLVVLVNEVTVDELHALFRKLNEQQGDCAETYTTGYRNGHRNGQIELLVRLLGFPDPHGGVTEAAVEQLKGEGEHG